MQPSLPKVLFGAAITLAVWIAIAQKRLRRNRYSDINRGEQQ
jgi:hypothetical protein